MGWARGKLVGEGGGVISMSMGIHACGRCTWAWGANMLQKKEETNVERWEGYKCKK